MRTSPQTILPTTAKKTIEGNKASEKAQNLPFTYIWDEANKKFVLKNENLTNSPTKYFVSQPIRSFNELMSLKLKNEISHKDFMCRNAELIKEFPQNAHNIFNLLINSGIKPDEYIYNNYIFACIKNNEPSKAINLYNEMKNANVAPNDYTFKGLFTACYQAKKYDLAFKLSSDLAKYEVDINSFIFNELLLCLKASKTAKNTNIISKILIEQQCILPFEQYNLVLTICLESGNYQDAFDLYSVMKERSVQTNSETYARLLDAADSQNRPSMILEIHEDIQNRMINLDLRSKTLLFNNFLKINELEKAYGILKKMINNGINPNLLFFEFLIESCYLNDKLAILNKLKYLMSIRKIPLIIFYNSLMRASSNINNKHTIKIFQFMLNDNVIPNTSSYNLVIKAKIENLQPKIAIEMYYEMKEREIPCDKDTFNLVMNAALKCNFPDKVFALLDEMRNSHLVLDISIYNLVIQACIETANLKEGRLQLDNMIKDKLRLNDITYTLLIRLGMLYSNFDYTYDILKVGINNKYYVENLGFDKDHNELWIDLNEIFTNASCAQDNRENGFPKTLARVIIRYHASNGMLKAGTKIHINCKNTKAIEKIAKEELISLKYNCKLIQTDNGKSLEIKVIKKTKKSHL